MINLLGQLELCKDKLEKELYNQFMISLGILRNKISLPYGGTFYYYLNINTRKYYYIQIDNNIIKYLATNLD